MTAEVEVKLAEIQSDVYTIDSINGILSEISVGTTVAELKSKLLNEATNIIVFDKDGIEYTGDILGTGMTVKLIVDDIIKDELTLSVFGDVSGDGVIDITDILYIRAIIIGTYTANSYEAPASDIDLDGFIDITDILYIRADILGTYTILAK